VYPHRWHTDAIPAGAVQSQIGEMVGEGVVIPAELTTPYWLLFGDFGKQDSSHDRPKLSLIGVTTATTVYLCMVSRRPIDSFLAPRAMPRGPVDVIRLEGSELQFDLQQASVEWPQSRMATLPHTLHLVPAMHRHCSKSLNHIVNARHSPVEQHTHHISVVNLIPTPTSIE
jgi:hypothetical protein